MRSAAETPTPSTSQLVAALITIAILALVVPPVLAARLNARRVERARADVSRLAEVLGPRETAAQDGGRMLAGHGMRPTVTARGWDLAQARPLDTALADEVSTDPWGNQYLVWLSDRAGARGFVLSAGPNGQINTDFNDRRAVAMGDDLIAWIQ